ncbi:hypothetical protein [Legionella shakespearei]|uniref:Uncharacterized protein n=1 Tax=Legionella shakespearei DSM 23087 TaxID=1122169 RepID=A0A0W0YMS7_9GAMM|nr:hypothetical protein [Legionella shakespearei]KTD57814.1 hypothetical protein Lsha_2248 [Legionella shakespearei DSM 23087]
MLGKMDENVTQSKWHTEKAVQWLKVMKAGLNPQYQLLLDALIPDAEQKVAHLAEIFLAEIDKKADDRKEVEEYKVLLYSLMAELTVEADASSKASSTENTEPAAVHVKKQFSVLAELEVYSSRINQLLAGRTYVPSCKIEDNHRMDWIRTIAVDRVPFESYHENPLHQDDLLFERSSITRKFYANGMVQLAGTIMKLLDKEYAASSLRHKVVSSLFHSLIPNRQRTLFADIMNQAAAASPEQIAFWLQECQFIQNQLKKNASYAPFLNELIEVLQHYQSLEPSEQDDMPLSMKELEALLSSEDKKKFADLKGLGRTLPLRLLLQDSDPNATNFSKDGTSIDFGNSKRPVVVDYLTTYHNQLRITDLLSFFKLRPVTEADLAQFPDIAYTPFFSYWPTWQTHSYQFMLELGIKLLDMSRKTTDDKLIENFAQMVIDVFTKWREMTAFGDQMDVFISIFYHLQLQLRSIWSWSSVADEERNLIFERLAKLWVQLNRAFQEQFQLEEHRIREKMGIQRRAFSEEDNQLFKKLAYHPVFMFYKNVTFLKYILMEPLVFECVAEDLISNPDLKAALPEDDIATQARVRDILLHSEQFQIFLLEHGSEALEIIEKEYAAEMDYIKDPESTDTHSPALSEGITSERLHQAYQQLMNDMDELEDEEQYGYGL